MVSGRALGTDPAVDHGHDRQRDQRQREQPGQDAAGGVHGPATSGTGALLQDAPAQRFEADADLCGRPSDQRMGGHAGAVLPTSIRQEAAIGIGEAHVDAAPAAAAGGAEAFQRQRADPDLVVGIVQAGAQVLVWSAMYLA